MSERERWIVYPLLFLALGASLRDKLLKQTFTETLRCEQLVCNEIHCEGGLQIVRGNQSLAELRDSNLRVTNINAGRVFQNGQPVLSLPQLLKMIGWGQGQPSQPEPPAGQRTPET